MDVVGFYHMGKVLHLSVKFFETRDNKEISSDTLAGLAVVVLKNKIFKFDEKTFKQKRATAIEAKFMLPHAMLNGRL